MVFMINKVLECLRVTEDVNIVIFITATLTIAMVECIGLKRPSTIPLEIVEQELILKGEAYIGLRPATLPPITQVAMVDFWFSLFLLVLLTKMFMVIRE